MNRSADFEMPSPKRIRLEAAEPDPAFDPATAVEGMDDLYDTPPMQPHSPTKSSHVLTPTLGNTASATDEKDFQLPGLGMLDDYPKYSLDTPEEQSQLCLPSSEAQRSYPEENPKDMGPELEHKRQDSGEPDAAVGGEHVVDIQIAKTDHSPFIVSEPFVGGNATKIAESGGWVSEVEAPISQDVTHSVLDHVQNSLDWHSSGTVVDKGACLHGIYAIENSPSTVPVSITGREGTQAEVVQKKDVAQSCGSVEEESFPGAKPVINQNGKIAPTKPTWKELVEANKDNEEAEYELDSSPLGSDSSSGSSTDTTSSDDSDVDDYEMLSPAEQARRLMAEDGVSDDDGKGKGRKAVAELPRTLNEKQDELVPKPAIAVTEDMKIEELGPVEHIVENLVLIKANTSGEYQVLESGSLLCLQDRSVIGVVSETLGRVQQPYYSVRFTNVTAIAEARLEKDTKVYYVVQHSTTVFTQPLKAFKGSDASNLHDEEVGDDELEFSDDEAEAEHKRQIKQQRMARRNPRDGQLDGFSRRPQQRPGPPGPRPNGGLHPVQEHPPNSAEAALNYDDADGINFYDKPHEDDLYTPLLRPPNLHEILSGKAPPMDNNARRGNVNRGRGDGRGGNKGRGHGRARGGDHGVRNSERGGKQNRENQGDKARKGQSYGQPGHQAPQTSGFGPSQANGLPPRPRPETIGYQRSTHQGDGFPHPAPLPSPLPPPAYHTQQQPQSHTPSAYPTQYPNAYNQTYFQPPPHQPQPSHFLQQNHSRYHQPHPPHFPQQNHPQYHQPQQFPSRQGYPEHSEHFVPQPNVSFPPRPQYPPSLPPGAHINPNFFKQQGQSSSPQGWQQGYDPQQQQQQQQAFPAGMNPGPATSVPNADKLQELLRGLGKGGEA